jgi:hypothetical protein
VEGRVQGLGVFPELLLYPPKLHAEVGQIQNFKR